MAKSRLGRLAKLGGLTSRVTGSYIADRVKDTFRDKDLRERARKRLHIDNAKEIADTMGKMKGAAMKLGQQMALAATSLDLPTEVADALGKLHAEAEAVPFELIKEDVEKELETPLADAFAWFDETPLGTASLGQAHAARLHDGTNVVVKVLHRGVEHSVDTDLMALKALLVGGRMLRRDRAEIDASFEEIRQRLTEELDYLQEAANIHLFNELYGRDDRFKIPSLHPSLCTERVLTMGRLPGLPLKEFLKTASNDAKQRAGHSLADLYYTSIWTHLVLHADPHPGNYLFEPDGTVGLLDYGCVKRFDEFWMGHYAGAAVAVMDGDRKKCLEKCEAVGSWDGTDQDAAELLWDFCRVMGQGLTLGEITLGVDEHAIDEMKPIIKRLMLNPRVRIPANVLFLHRSLGGLYALCLELGTRTDFGAIARPHAEFAIARAEGRI
jgi:predicted unusual protein kinase regulating ubiquinone biosynthesis (AarF/ABC1/UbiB family)